MLRIGIQTWGTEGDIRPFIALSRGLASAGHEVRFSFVDLSHAVSPRMASESGAKEWVSLPPVHDLEGFSQATRKVLDTESRSKVFERILEKFLYPLESALSEDAERLCRESDLVVGHCLLYPLAAAAAKLHRPRVVVLLSPVQPSRDWVPSGVPHMGRWLNGLFWVLGRTYFERTFRAPVERHFRAHGLAAPRSILDDVWSSRLLNLVAVSPSLFPQPPDWPAHTVVSGALSTPENRTWDMPESLRAFLAAGPAPVFATFGSLSTGERDVPSAAALLVEGALRAGRRAIVQSDWTRAASIPEHPSIYRLARAPHSAVFPLCSAVIHHGGAGTSHAASRAGRPSIVVAHAADQLFWAATLRRAGLAPAPLERRSVTADSLARAIRQVTESTELARRAIRAGETMRAEDGVKTAVERIGALSTALEAAGGLPPQASALEVGGRERHG
jgi:sterol 3beta-glucosyltransferase